jgi:succinate dehydrogenase/fumarate reductase flavoprotein subunit
MLILASWFGEKLKERTMIELKVIPVETDILIIGGGLAGCMAAIKAAEEKGLRVIVAEKDDTLASGKAGTGVDHFWSYIPPVHEKTGYTIDDMMEDRRLSLPGANPAFIRDDLYYRVASTMYDRMLDLEKFGINFRYEDSKVPGNFRVVYQYHSVPSSFNFDGALLKRRLTNEMKRRGVRILNRVQMTDLIETDGQISGAVGIGTRSADIYFFKSKAVVLCAGGLTRIRRNASGLDFNTFLPPTCTGDGSSMAFRAGLPVINKEALGGKRHLRAGANYNPNYGEPGNTTQPAARIIDWKGNVIVPRTHFYDWENLGKKKWSLEDRQSWLKYALAGGTGGGAGFKARLTELHNKGEGPFYLDFSEATDYEAQYIEWSIKNEGRGTQFMRYFKDEEGFDLRKVRQEYAGFGTPEGSSAGLWVDQDFETEIKNLFAAGDEVGGFLCSDAPGAVAGGWYAGGMAIQRAKAQKELLPVDEGIMQDRKAVCSEIINCERGFFWKEIELYIQNLMDFYCSSTRSEPMLKRGLERLEHARAAPLKADNPHELARSLEVKSIMDNAEMILRCSLERKESRLSPFGFMRADYPEQNDKEWFCYLGIRRKDDGFEFSKYRGIG